MSNKQTVKSLIQGGKWEDAKCACVKLCHSGQQDADLWLLMGVIHGHFDCLNDAEKCCRRVIKLSPTAPVGHYNLAVILIKQRKFSDAARVLQSVIRLNPNYAEAYNELAVALHLSGGDVNEIVKSYQRAITLKPGYAEAHYNLATFLCDKAKVDDASVHFIEAIKLQPGMVKAYLALGKMYCSVGLLDNACSVYRDALRIHEADAEIHCQLAMALMSLGRNSEALESFYSALELSPGNAKIYAGIAKVLERIGDFSGGYELLKKYLDSSDPDVDVVLTYAVLARHLGKQRQAIDLLKRLSANSNLSSTCKSIHFTLGKLYDEVQDYTTAFLHWQRANELSNKKFDPKKNTRFFHDLKSVFSLENVSRHPRAINLSSLPVFIVGMPRSGTSLVEQILSSHPDVYGAGELQDIDNLIKLVRRSSQPYPRCIDSIDELTVNEISKSHLERLALFSDRATRVTDKMPHNFRHLGLIDMLFPGARIIHCLRDPIDTCLSIYSLNFTDNHSYSTDLLQLGEYYRQYQDLMAHWKSVLRIPILEVHYEDIVACQEEVSRKLIDFCGLDWDDRCLRFHESERVVTTPSYDQVRRPIYNKSVARWKNYETYLAPLISALGITTVTDSDD